MKKKLLHMIFMGIKFSLPGFLLTCLLLQSVLASDIKAQEVRSIKEVRVKMAFDQVTVREAFNRIEQNTNFIFIYNDYEIDVDQKISASIKKEQLLSDLLLEISRQAKLQFKQVNRNISVKKISSDEPNQQQIEVIIQTRKVTGKVTSFEDNEGLPGVTVLEKGTTNGTITNVNGEYAIEVTEGATLVFSSVGYTTEEVAVGNRSVVDIVMNQNIQQLQELVVIGYGERSKRDITSAISSISSDEINKVQPSTPELLMQGQMSGVQIIGNQGDPNARPTVRIRGTNTFGIADPLYVIDGIPVKEYGAGIEGGGNKYSYTRGNINVMAMIDPNDIESISVLKDAAAAAIYGVRAANGVVLITTKRGSKEKTTINFSQRTGIQNVRQKIDLLNTQQYVDFNNALYASDPTSEGSRSPLNDVFRPDNPGYLGNMDTYDWQDVVKNKNALTQDYSVNVSGGSEKADYYVSFGYSDQEGTLIDQYMERYSGSIKLNLEVNDYIKVGLNYMIASAVGRSHNGDVESLLKTALTPVAQPIYDENGKNGFAQAVKGYDENGAWNSSVLYGSLTRNNYLGIYSLIYGNNSSLRNMGSAYVDIKPIDGLTLTGKVSLDYFDNTRKGGEQYISSIFKYNGANPNGMPPGSVGGYAQLSTINYNFVSEFSANYLKSFGNHNLDFLFNTMAQSYEAKWLDVGTDYVTSTNPDIINLGGEKQYTRAGGFTEPGALYGMLFRVGYNYNNRYYLDATVRRDGSARFAPENRFGIFPGVSAAWRISDEAFMKNLTFLDDLKIRAGWGQLGNQETANLAYLSTISTAPTYAWGNNPSPRTSDPTTIGLGYTSSAAAVYGMANRDLNWEKTTTFNIGFDAKLFDGLNVSLEYYDKLTDGILQTFKLPPSTGIIYMPKGNVANVNNNGIELNANYSGQVGDVAFSFGGNLTTVNNKVKSLYNGIPMWNIEEGMPLFYIKGYQVDGIFQSHDEAQQWMASKNDLAYKTAQVTAGDFYFKDLRGAPKQEDIEQGINRFYSPDPDNVVDSYDQVYLGKTIPGFYYGANFNLQYKGIDFSALLTGVGDVQKVNETKSTFGMPYGEAMNHTPDVLKAWTPENPNTNVPRMIWSNPAANNRFSNYFVEDAGYLRLANIQLGYTLPSGVYSGLNNILKNSRIYVGSSNLFTLTKFGGLDPEDQNNPAPLIIYAGISARF